MTDMKFDTRPESAGFSTAGLRQLTARVQAGIDAGKIPGAVMLICRKEQLAYAQALGRQGPDSQRAMICTPSSLPWLSSMRAKRR